MSGFLNDLRFGLRQLVKKPGFAAAAVLTLALGIGANTAVFSILNGYLLKPLPYPHGAELAQVDVLSPKMFTDAFPISYPIYHVIQKHTHAFAAMGHYTEEPFDLHMVGHAERVFGDVASASLFHVLGIRPLLGHTFTTKNMHKGSNLVMVISYGLWRSVFGADPNVVGKMVHTVGSVYRIIGVMPKGFAFPDRKAVLWVPHTISPSEFNPKGFLALGRSFIGRLKPGVSPDAAKAQVRHAVGLYVQNKVSAQRQRAIHNMGFALDVQPYHQVLLGNRPATLWLLQGAVALILLITCVNVANLLLSRILGRSHEMAMRSALGATRGALARQLLGEALCLTVPGGLVGVALAWLALHFVAGSFLGAENGIFNVAFDWRIGLFALGAVSVTAVLVSVLPIRHLAKTDLQLVFREGGRSASGGRRTKRTRNALVIAELTLATGLLAMAGLLLHSFMNLEAVDPGFRKDHLLIAGVMVPSNDHTGKAALSSFYADLLRRVDALPGVRQAGIGAILPLNSKSNLLHFSIPGQTPASGKPPEAMINGVSQEYFKALGIPLLRGRLFNARDAGKTSAIVDAGLVEKYFHGANPIGRQIKLGDTKFTIVGVVPTVKYKKLSQTTPSVSIYLDVANFVQRPTELVIHTSLPPSTLIKPVQKLIATVDPSVAVYGVHTMQEQLSNSLHDKRTTMTLLLAFGGIALALAIVGVYAVMSYAVGQRRAECGIRLALGAQPGDLQWLILKDGLKLLVVGLILGLGLAVAFGYILSSQLFGVAPFDPLTLIGSAVVLCVITLAACYLPARRAAKVDPATAIMEQ